MAASVSSPVMRIRIKPRERALYEKAARRERRTLSNWVRATLDKAMSGDPLPAPSRRGRKGKLTLMGLYGLGKEVWKGVDAQEYINSLRDGWGR